MAAPASMVMRRGALQLFGTSFASAGSALARSDTSCSGSVSVLTGLARGLTTQAFHAGHSGRGDDTTPRTNVFSAAMAAVGLTGATILASPVSADAPSTSSPAPVPADPYARPSAPRPLPEKVVLYQYEVCPYCCKVKAALDFYKVPYRVVEVNPLTKGELKGWSNYKKVPIIKMGEDDVVNDSSAIMSRLAVDAAAASKAGAAKYGRGTGAASEADEAQWRAWVDTRLVKVLTANIYRSWGESVGTFKYITDQTNWSWGTREMARWSGAVLMWQIGKRLPSKYDIKGDLREALYKSCDEFVEAVGPLRPFHGGSIPNLADLSVYGILRAVKHTPTWSDVMAGSKIAPWYARMDAAVGDSARLPDQGAAGDKEAAQK